MGHLNRTLESDKRGNTAEILTSASCVHINNHIFSLHKMMGPIRFERKRLKDMKRIMSAPNG